MRNTTDINGNPVNAIGTSAATAFVAGTILKNRCIDPEKNAEDIIADIKSELALKTYDDVGDEAPNDNNVTLLTFSENNDIIVK